MIQLLTMRIIGLTGPNGAGKSEAAKILARRGACIIDADQLAHTLYRCKSPLWKKIVKVFGTEILIRGGEIDRKKVGAIVFSDHQKLKKLNQLIHPILKLKIKSLVVAKRVVSCKLIVINAAVLKEIGLVGLCDEVWLVWASKERRKKRAGRLIKFQMNKKEYLKFADVMIENNGTKESLKKKVLARVQI